MKAAPIARTNPFAPPCHFLARCILSFLIAMPRGANATMALIDPHAHITCKAHANHTDVPSIGLFHVSRGRPLPSNHPRPNVHLQKGSLSNNARKHTLQGHNRTEPREVDALPEAPQGHISGTSSDPRCPLFTHTPRLPTVRARSPGSKCVRCHLSRAGCDAQLLREEAQPLLVLALGEVNDVTTPRHPLHITIQRSRQMR